MAQKTSVTYKRILNVTLNDPGPDDIFEAIQLGNGVEQFVQHWSLLLRNTGAEDADITILASGAADGTDADEYATLYTLTVSAGSSNAVQAENESAQWIQVVGAAASNTTTVDATFRGVRYL